MKLHYQKVKKMKTTHLNKFIMISALLFLYIFTTNCKKDDTTVQPPVNQNENNLVLKSIGWEVTFSAGHYFNDCSGTCGTLPYLPYTPVHYPCWSFGHNCTHTIGISIFKKKSSFSLPENLDQPFDTEITLIGESEESGFPFPARSFSYVKDNVQYWLNVPSQDVQKPNNTDNVYILKNIYFSLNKSFSNN